MTGLLFEISKNKKLGYIDIHGELIAMTEEKANLHVANYEGAVRKDAIVAFEDKHRFGFRTVLEEVVIPAQFDNAGSFDDGFGLIGKHMGTWYYKEQPRETYFWGYVDQTGDTAIDCTFINAYPFHQGVALVQAPDPDDFHRRYTSEPARWSLIDRTGTPVVETIFQWAMPFSEGLAAVQFDNKFGFINTDGEFVVKPIFDMVTPFKSGVSRVVMDQETPGAIDVEKESGRIIVSPNLKGRMGLIDYQGNFVFEPVVPAPTLHFNSEYFDFHEGMCRIEKEGKFGFINWRGEEVVPAVYDDAGYFSEALVSVKWNGKYGYINKDGTFEIDPTFIYGWEFREGLAPIRQRVSVVDLKTGKKKYKNKWGFIDHSGKTVIDPIYVSASQFHDGVAMVNFDQGMGYINKAGDTIWKEVS